MHFAKGGCIIGVIIMAKLTKAQLKKRLNEAGNKISKILADPNMAWMKSGLTYPDYKKLQAIQQDLFKYARKIK